MLIFKTNIMTREEFAEKWQQQHYPTMDLRAEVPFYYDIYIKDDAAPRSLL